MLSFIILRAFAKILVSAPLVQRSLTEKFGICSEFSVTTLSFVAIDVLIKNNTVQSRNTWTKWERHGGRAGMT